MSKASRQRFVAFLRGINVGGRRVSMQRLCECFDGLRLCNVRSFIASGNVIFDCTGMDADALEQRIERAVEEKLSFESATFLRTLGELEQAMSFKPFGREGENESFRQHIVFVRKPLTKVQSHAIEQFSNDHDVLVAKGKEIHWLCRGSFHESKIKQPALTKAAGGPWTARNVQTIAKLVQQLGAASM